jgi:hypothetical protein
MIELKRKQELTNITITKLDKRIKDLESLTNKLNERLNEESIKRKDLETIYNMSSENNNFQIKALKESIEQLAKIFNTSLQDMKTSFSEEINNKIQPLKEKIDDKNEKIEEIINNKKNDEINHQNSLKDFNLNFVNIEQELKLCKNIFEENDKKFKNLEKIVNDDHTFMEEQIKVINNQFNAIDNESKINKKFKTNINKNIADIESAQRQQNEIINNIKENYDSYMSNFEEKLKNYYSYIMEESDKMLKMQNDINNHLDITDGKNMAKLKELSEFFDKEINIQQNEIENFEKHVLEEHNHFSEYFQEKLKNLDENLNKNINLNTANIKQIKILMKNLNDETENLKLKFNDNINDLNKFHNKKNDALLKILMNNNLIPPDFDYKNFCSWNYNSNELNSSSYRNNYNYIIKSNNSFDENIN